MYYGQAAAVRKSSPMAALARPPRLSGRRGQTLTRKPLWGIRGAGRDRIRSRRKARGPFVIARHYGTRQFAIWIAAIDGAELTGEVLPELLASLRSVLLPK